MFSIESPSKLRAYKCLASEKVPTSCKLNVKLLGIVHTLGKLITIPSGGFQISMISKFGFELLFINDIYHTFIYQISTKFYVKYIKPPKNIPETWPNLGFSLKNFRFGFFETPNTLGQHLGKHHKSQHLKSC